MSASGMRCVIGLYASKDKKDKIFNPIYVDANRVEQYLKNQKQVYEILWIKPDDVLRPYIDLDGRYETDDEIDFEAMNEMVITALHNVNYETKFNIQQSSCFNCNKKLSYAISFPDLKGTNKAVKTFTKKMFKKISEYFTEQQIGIEIVSAHSSKLPETNYLNYDESVYDPNRKWRANNSSKPNENRPKKLCRDDVSVLDTLATYVPDTCVMLPEPITINKKKIVVKKKLVIEEEDKPVQQEEQQEKEEEEDNTFDVNKLNKEHQLIWKVLDALSQKRYDEYLSWITIGMACFNENIPLQLWDEFSKKSDKYAKGECEKKWKTFKKDSLSQATLWAWLKEDNMEVYLSLVSQRKDFQRLVCSNFTHAEVATFFYNTQLENYLWENGSGWWILQKNNTWLESGSKSAPPSLKYDILKVFTELRLRLQKTLTEEQTEELNKIDDEKQDAEKIKRLDELNKSILFFKQKIESNDFQNQVIGQLAGFYQHRTNDLLIETNKTNIKTELMNNNPYVFTFTDGYCYDFKINDFRKLKATDYVSITCGYKKPTASNPVARKELNDLLFSLWEDEDMKEYVMKLFTLCMCGLHNVEGFYIMTGRGGNGKGLIFELLQNVLGKYYYPFNNAILTGKKQQAKGEPEKVKFHGVRMATTTELEATDKMSGGIIKELTGGDPLMVRDNFAKAVDMLKIIPQFQMFLQVNGLPIIKPMDEGITRRLRVIPFPFIFTENPIQPHERLINPKIKTEKCKSEEWRNEMCLMMLENYKNVAGLSLGALGLPELVKEATEDYIKDCAVIGEWFKENYEKDETGESVLLTSELLPLYNSTLGKDEKKATPKDFKAGLDFIKVYVSQGSAGFYKGKSVIKGYKQKPLIIKQVSNELEEQEEY